MQSNKLKFILGSLFILVAVVVLVVTSMLDHAEYFLTVDELQAQGQAAVGRNLRISGAVVGSTIQYDTGELSLSFEIAHVPGEQDEIDARGGLAAVLHEAVEDPSRARVLVVYHGAIPDLLQNEAQAIATGTLGEDGVFYADELLLKCPTKYEEQIPAQVVE